MTVSVRLPLIAGTVVAMTAGALVAVPAAHPERLAQALATSTAEVSLSSWSNPFTQLLGTLELSQDYLLASYYNGGDAPTPGAGEANWPFAGFDQTGGDALNYALYQQKQLGYNSYVGNFPNTTANASPLIQQIQVNLSGYANAGLSGLIAAGVAIGDGIWNYPSELLTAAQYAVNGQISEAINVLVAAVVGPAVAVTDILLSTGAYIGGTVIARLGAVIGAIPAIVTKFVGWAIGGTALLAEQTAAIASTWIGKVAALDFEGAWNTAVDGLLGPAGLPGTALNLSLGAGIQTGPILTEADIKDNFIPSLRTSVNSAVWTIQDAMTTQAPGSAQARAAAATEAPAAEVASPRAAVAEAQAGQSESTGTAAVETGVGKDAPAESRGAAAAVRKDGASAARGGERRATARAAAAGE